MRRQGGGFGTVILLVVVAVVLYLVARNWKSVAPTAMEIHDRNQRRATAGSEYVPEKVEAPSGGKSEDAWTPSPPVNPSLGAMESRTSAHTQSVNEALQQSQ